MERAFSPLAFSPQAGMERAVGAWSKVNVRGSLGVTPPAWLCPNEGGIQERLPSQRRVYPGGNAGGAGRYCGARGVVVAGAGPGQGPGAAGGVHQQSAPDQPGRADVFR